MQFQEVVDELGVPRLLHVARILHGMCVFGQQNMVCRAQSAARREAPSDLLPTQL